MVELPHQLCKPGYGFILLGQWDEYEKGEKPNIQRNKFYPGTVEELERLKDDGWRPCGKAAFEGSWQTKFHKFDSPELKAHLEKGWNYGIQCGLEGLRIRDIDDPLLANELISSGKIDTFAVKTGKGIHLLYECPEYQPKKEDGKPISFKVLSNGEIRISNSYVVAAGSKHPIGHVYTPLNDLPIEKISAQELEERWINPFLKESINNTSSIEVRHPSKEMDESRSAAEYRKVVSLLFKGWDKLEIFRKMREYAKWAQSGDQYKEYTYNKALKYYQEKKKNTDTYEQKKYAAQFQMPEEEGKAEEPVKLEVFTDKDLNTYEPKPQKWLIENAIPAGEIGVLVGKRMERKTFTALHLALCAASQREAFGIEKVSEKARVLIATEEDSIDTLATRIKILKQAMGLSSEALEIKYLAFTGVKLDRADKKREAFLSVIEEFKPTLIILDALQRFVTFEIDKDNRSISALFTDLIRPLQQKLGCGWLIIHHMRKPSNNGNSYISDPLDEVRGGSEIVNYCRYVLMCQKPKNQNTDIPGQEFILFRVLKMSNAAMPEDKVIAYTPGPDGLKVEYIGKPEDILSGEQQAANAIKNYLLTAGIKGEFKTSQIVDAASEIGFKKSLLSEGLGVLVKEGILKKLKRGVYKVTSSNDDEVTVKGQTTLTGKKKKEDPQEEPNEFEEAFSDE